jgi:hypothetical protein
VSPFWWIYTGTSILEGIAFCDIVTEANPPAVRGLTRFYETENSNIGDHFYTTSYSEYKFVISAAPGAPGYGNGVFDTLYIFGDNEPNTVPF